MSQDKIPLDKMTDKQAAEVLAAWEGQIGPAIDKALDEVGQRIAGFRRKDGERDARRIVASSLLAFAIAESSRVLPLNDMRAMVRALIDEIAKERGEL